MISCDILLILSRKETSNKLGGGQIRYLLKSGTSIRNYWSNKWSVCGFENLFALLFLHNKMENGENCIWENNQNHQNLINKINVPMKA